MEMESTGNIFGGTMKKLNEMINFGGGGHMLKLSLFIFCLFIIVYYMVR